MATLTIFAGTGLSLLPELLYPEKYKIVYQLHVLDQTSNRVPLPLSQTLVKTVQQELSKTYPDKPPNRIDPFYYHGIEKLPLAGSLNSSRGAILGLPFYFKYSDDSQLNDLIAVLKEGGFEFPTDHLATSFSRTMLLSDAAKRFAISRAIHQLSYDTFKCKLAAFSLGGVSGAFLWFMCQWSMDLKKSATWARAVSVISVLVAVANYVLIRGLIFNYIEKKADQKCANMGPDYVAGGYELYEKTITRNKVARLLNSELAGLYNYFGNETTLFTLKTRTVNRFDEFDAYCKTLSTALVE